MRITKRDILVFLLGMFVMFILQVFTNFKKSEENLERDWLKEKQELPIENNNPQ